MKRGLSHARCPWLAALLLAATLAPVRAVGSAHLEIRAIPVGILPDALALDAPAHRLFVANTGSQVPITPQITTEGPPPALADRTSPGSLSVIDTRTNRINATLPLDVWPLEMALDAGRQRLYVLCADALPVRISPVSGYPADLKPTLDVIDARTLRVLARRRLDGMVSVDISLPSYPPHVLTLDPASGHLLVQATNRHGGEAPTIAAYLYDAASGHLLHTYPAPPPLPPSYGFFAAQTPSTPLLIYAKTLVLPTSTATASTTTALLGQPWQIDLASGRRIRLRDVVLFRSWGEPGPLPFYSSGPGSGPGRDWTGEIRAIYATSTLSRLLVLTAYSTEDQYSPGPPYTLGIYSLHTGALLRQLAFADGPPEGQQAVAFDEHLGRYYALGTAPNPAHPVLGAPVTNIVTGDLRTGAVLHTTPGKGHLAVVLADPARHLVYAASGGGVDDEVLTVASAGVLQVIDGRTGATLATAVLPTHAAKAPGAPPVQAAGQVTAMALDPATGAVYAVDGHGGNTVYVISLTQT